MSGDFLPVIQTTETVTDTEDGLRVALAAVAWVAALILLACAPAVIVVAWRWAL